MTNCTRCGDIWDEIMDVCHSCAARLVMWLDNGRGRIPGNWRRRAFQTMAAVVRENRDMAATDPAALLKLVDDAYPFGERAMHPYNAWLAERKELIAVVKPEKAPPAPTQDDYAAVLVAEDLIEMGREDEARKLLVEQAPRRLNRKCPACGAKVGKACRDVETKTMIGAVPGPTTGTGTAYPIALSKQRIVPHLARVEPQRPAPMPLFDGSEP